MNTKTDVVEMEAEVEFDKDTLKRVYLKQIFDSRTSVILFLSRAMAALASGLVDVVDEAVRTKIQHLLKCANDTGLDLCGMKIDNGGSAMEYLNSSENAMLCFLEALPLLLKHSKVFAADCPDTLYAQTVKATEDLLYSMALLEIAHPAVFGCPGCPSCQPDTETPTSETSTQKTSVESGRVLH